MEKLGDHALPWNQRQALNPNLFPGPQRLSAPAPHLQKSHPCAQHPEAGVTLTTSDSLHLTPPPQTAVHWDVGKHQASEGLGSSPAVSEGATRGCRPAWLCHQPRATLAFFHKSPLHSPCPPLPGMTRVLRTNRYALPSCRPSHPLMPKGYGQQTAWATGREN